MADITPVYGFPYPEPDDKVADCPPVIENLAELIESELVGLESDILAKPDTWAELADKPATFPPAAHSHDWVDITGEPATFPPAAHNHPIGEVTGLQLALNAKAPLSSPAFTDVPTAPTAAPGTNTPQLANTAFVAAAIAALISSAPGVLDTLDELAAALGDDPNFAATIATQLAGKQPIDPTLTALATLVGSANKLAYFNGGETMALADLTAFARSILDDPDASTVLSTLGVSTFIKTLLDDADASTARATLGAAPAVTAVFVPPAGMIAHSGSPSITGTTQMPRWLLDPSANEALVFEAVIPPGWATLDVYFYWAPTDANGGDIRFQVGFDTGNTVPFITSGMTFGFFTSGWTTTLAAPGVSNRVTRSKINGAALSTGGASGLSRWTAQRDAAGVGDTYGADVAIVAVELVKVS